ncbi:hypothetical protein CF386_07640 [Paraphotobacterium marinum]|uniref:Uncharacterized protein n=1 Tax=Paraphotobacterium marinum TaxID=1755811 RepID=A0A220VFG7_9GAMM|nr:hypothetical protein [Paraphotobacterium marinum]ASK78932.1 hypothetical protein CF386_07640 [Paraphotobacterium marinum]
MFAILLLIPILVAGYTHNIFSLSASFKKYQNSQEYYLSIINAGALYVSITAILYVVYQGLVCTYVVYKEIDFVNYGHWTHFFKIIIITLGYELTKYNELFYSLTSDTIVFIVKAILFTIISAYIFPVLWCKFLNYKLENNEKNLTNLYINSLDEMTYTTYTLMKKHKSILITLKNNKVYLVHSIEIDIDYYHKFNHDSLVLKCYPQASGYRDNNTHTLKFTTLYPPQKSNDESSLLFVFILRSQIQMVQPFDPLKYNKEKKKMSNKNEIFNKYWHIPH